MTEFDDHFARLGKHERAVVAEALERINQKLAKRDAMADWMIGILEPHIRKLIKQEIENAKSENVHDH
jgi:hypothetical protein